MQIIVYIHELFQFFICYYKYILDIISFCGWFF